MAAAPAMQAVSRWLQQTKGIAVQDEWLGACTEWILNEEGRSLPQRRLQELVYEQWLHADLRDVVVQPCVPLYATQQQTCQITGQYIVQVDSLVDVGVPAYSQLQKLKGQSLGTADTPNGKRNYEPKPTRLLLLNLTDGMLNIQAMEYQSIPQLNAQILPGTKLQLQGTINCRLGLLLLTPNHVRILGGKVEALMEMNQQKKVLAKMLNNENLADEEGQAATSRQPAVSQQPSHPPHLQGEGRNFNSGADVMIMEVVPPRNSRQDQIDLTGSSSVLNTRGRDTGRFPTSGHTNTEEDLLALDDQSLHSETAILDYRTRRTSEFAAYGLDQIGASTACGSGLDDPAAGIGDVDFDDFENFDMDHENEQEGLLRERSEGLTFGDLLKQKDDGICMVKDIRYNTEGGQMKLPCAMTKKSGITDIQSSTSRDTSSSHGPPEKLAPRPLSLKQTKSRGGINYRETSANSVPNRKSSLIPVVPVRPFGRSPSEVKTEDERLSPELTFHTPRFDGSCVNDSPVLVSSLAELTQASAWKQHPVVKVKARFVKVVEKLCHENGVWMVTVLLGDESWAKLKVHLSNEILERLIGFTAGEFREHIMPYKSDKTVKAKARQGFKHCQSALADLNCYMELRKKTSHVYPFVERLLDA